MFWRTFLDKGFMEVAITDDYTNEDVSHIAEYFNVILNSLRRRKAKICFDWNEI